MKESTITKRSFVVFGLSVEVRPVLDEELHNLQLRAWNKKFNFTPAANKCRTNYTNLRGPSTMQRELAAIRHGPWNRWLRADPGEIRRPIGNRWLRQCVEVLLRPRLQTPNSRLSPPFPEITKTRREKREKKRRLVKWSWAHIPSETITFKSASICLSVVALVWSISCG